MPMRTLRDEIGLALNNPKYLVLYVDFLQKILGAANNTEADNTEVRRYKWATNCVTNWAGVTTVGIM